MTNKLPQEFTTHGWCFLCVLLRTPDDVDIFPAVISETPVSGGMVGPTVVCLIARQFQNLRNGDRFWYENEGDEGFPQGMLGWLNR